jgi:hypothetical protein
VNAAGGGTSATIPTVAGELRQMLTKAVVNGPEAPTWLIAWAGDPVNMMSGTIAYDANGAITSASVVWPDGAAGTYTATVLSTAFPGATDAYTVTYNGGPPSGVSPWSGISKIVTQPTVTRDAAGRVTLRPQRTVA